MLVALGLVVLACDVPLLVDGYPLGSALRALGGLAATAGLLALRPRPLLRAARRGLLVAATLVALSAALVLVDGFASGPSGLAPAVAAGAAAVAAYLGLGGLARVAQHRAWSYATRASLRAQIGATSACLLLFLGALGSFLSGLVLPEPPQPVSHAPLVLAAALCAALATCWAVSALAWSARDHATLSATAPTFLAASPRLSAWFAAALVFLPPLALESWRVSYHLGQPSYRELRLASLPPWDVPDLPAPAQAVERWEGLAWSSGSEGTISVEEPADAFGPDRVSRRYRFELALTRGDERVAVVGHSILATFQRSNHSLRGVSVATRRAMGTGGQRLLIHTWIDLNAPSAPGQLRTVPFVVFVTVARGGDLKVGGTQVRGLEVDRAISFQPRISGLVPLDYLQAVRRPRWALRGYEVLQAPLPTASGLRFYVRLDGELSVQTDTREISLSAVSVLFSTSHEDRSYQLRLDQEDTVRDGSSRRRTTHRLERERHFLWRGELW
jgi:hypothetical protein